MKLFWGLIETHTHTFDPEKWISVGKYEVTSRSYVTRDLRTVEHIEYYQNKCLKCGDIIEKSMSRANVMD
jgi:hypothetical protein